MKLVPVIIPFYKAHDELEKCKAHLRASTYSNIEVFVHDNSENNIYFTAAINEGLRKYAYRPDVDYVLVLNQNAYVFPDAIAHLVEFMETRPDVAISSPLQLTWDGSKVTWGGSKEVWPCGVHITNPLESYVQPEETPWASGSCMLIRTAAIQEVGLFDKRLRFLCSDSDFCFGVRARGWKVFLVPSARILHEFEGSRKHIGREIEKIKAQDLILFAEKWLTDDLFKRLTYQGKSLGRLEVRHEIERFRQFL